MQIGSEGSVDPTALESVLSVVAEARDHLSERLGAVVEIRSARVVLEARERRRHAGFELALEEHVADHAPLTGDRVLGEEPDPWQLRPRAVAVEAAEKLVAAAAGQERR